jgi:hypothetical protein
MREFAKVQIGSLDRSIPWEASQLAQSMPMPTLRLRYSLQFTLEARCIHRYHQQDRTSFDDLDAVKRHGFGVLRATWAPPAQQGHRFQRVSGLQSLQPGAGSQVMSGHTPEWHCRAAFPSTERATHIGMIRRADAGVMTDVRRSSQWLWM